MNTCDYNNQRPWSDRFLTQDKKILVNVLKCDESLIEITTPETDMQEAADLIIKSNVKGERDVYVAVRTRTSAYAERYSDEFTIRAHYTAGYKTEYEKIMEGYADIMLYGFVINNIITRWILLDLHTFREEAEENYIVKEHKHNRDGRNSFYAYNINSFKCTKSFYPDILISWSDGYFSENIINKLKENFYGS